MRRTLLVVIPLAGLIGCGDEAALSDQPLTPEQIDTVATSTMLVKDDLPDAFDWEMSEDNPAYLDTCAIAAMELTGAGEGIVVRTEYDSYSGSHTGEAGDHSEPTSVRVRGAGTVYETELGAAEGFSSFDEEDFVDCMADGIATAFAGFEDETTSAGDMDAVDFQNRSESPGDESTLHSAYFSAAVVAGFDDFEETDVIVTRVGPAVLAIVVRASAQNLSPGATREVTLDIAEAVSRRVRAALD